MINNIRIFVTLEVTSSEVENVACGNFPTKCEQNYLLTQTTCNNRFVILFKNYHSHDLSILLSRTFENT